MDINPATGANVSAALEIKSLQMAKSQQQQEGQAALQLLEASATSAPAASANPNVGSIINTYA